MSMFFSSNIHTQCAKHVLSRVLVMLSNVLCITRSYCSVSDVIVHHFFFSLLWRAQAKETASVTIL